jgi:hypothetical protein
MSAPIKMIFVSVGSAAAEGKAIKKISGSDFRHFFA